MIVAARCQGAEFGADPPRRINVLNVDSTASRSKTRRATRGQSTKMWGISDSHTGVVIMFSQPSFDHGERRFRRSLRFLVDVLDVGRSQGTSHAPHSFRASASDSCSAALVTSLGTQSGKAIVTSLWAPDSVCSSRMASRRREPITSASRTSAGHKRRWTYVILPSSNRQTSTSGESRTARVARKISRPLGWPHHVPGIASPAMAAANDGTGPRPLSRTTPCFATKASARSGDTLSRMSRVYP